MADMTFKANLNPNTNSYYSLGTTDKKWKINGVDAILTDEKVKTTSSTTSSWQKILLQHGAQANIEQAVTGNTNQVYANQYIEAQPSTGSIRGKNFIATSAVTGRLINSNNEANNTNGSGFFVQYNNITQGYLQYGTLGPAGTQGVTVFSIGNSRNNSTSANSKGQINLWGTEETRHILVSDLLNNNGFSYTTSTSSNGYVTTSTYNYRAVHFQNYKGNQYLAHTGSTSAVGNANVPVYVAENGRLTAGTSVTGTYVHRAGDSMIGNLNFINSTRWPGFTFQTSSANAKVAEIFWVGATASPYNIVESHLAFRQYSYDKTTPSPNPISNRYETFYLPSATPNSTVTASTYNILTSKYAVTIAQGGTSATNVIGARTNLGLWSLISDTYNTLMPANGTSNGWVKLGTSNNSYGLLPSQTGEKGSGHNYIGASTWWWNSSYINTMNSSAINTNTLAATSINAVTINTQTLNATAITAYKLRLTSTSDAGGGTANANVALVIGSQTGSHIEIDTNEILAKSSATVCNILYLQDSAGQVQICGTGGLSVTAGHLHVESKNIYAEAGSLIVGASSIYTNLRGVSSTSNYRALINGNQYTKGFHYCDYLRIYNNASTSSCPAWWYNNNTGYGYLRLIAGNTTTCGYSQLWLGNARPSGTAECARGQIIMYGTGTAYSVLMGAMGALGGTTRTYISAGYFSGTQLWGAVYNDYAEFRETKNKIEPGRCVVEQGNGSLKLATERLMRGGEIVSDTYGFAIGETDKAKTPIAASGRVLAYCYEGQEIAKKYIGWPVGTGPNGTVSIMTEEEERLYPSRIIGIISEIPTYSVWQKGSREEPEYINVNGRIWIRIR